jgi:hypothetical protein
MELLTPTHTKKNRNILVKEIYVELILYDAVHLLLWGAPRVHWVRDTLSFRTHIRVFHHGSVFHTVPPKIILIFERFTPPICHRILQGIFMATPQTHGTRPPSPMVTLLIIFFAFLGHQRNNVTRNDVYCLQVMYKIKKMIARTANRTPDVSRIRRVRLW